MSARYGSRTRTGSVPGWGRTGVGANPAWVFYEEEFTSPGTWTCPPTVTHVDVIVVGGGGGGGAGWTRPGFPQPFTGYIYGFGGGGAGGEVQYIEGFPVSGPMPVTIGSGGTGGIVNGPDGTAGLSSAATAGGNSRFGPPSPPTNNSILSYGGGGGGSAGGLGPDGYVDPVPRTPMGGVGGKAFMGPPSPQSGQAGPPNPVTYSAGGYATSSNNWQNYPGGGGAGHFHAVDSTGAAGLFGFGGGGGARGRNGSHGGGRSGQDEIPVPGPAGSDPTVPGIAEPGVANTGGGGGGGGCSFVPTPISSPSNFRGNGGNGGSGIVIVGWWERA